MIDQQSISPAEKIRTYDTVRTRFGFLNRLEDVNAENLYGTAEHLVEVYKDDLEPSLGNELYAFSERSCRDWHY